MSVSDFRQLGTYEGSPEFAALTSQIVFDREGDQLLAFGAPGRSVMLSGRNGHLKYYPEWLSVQKGTSVVRDPDQDGGFLVGDQLGRISNIPFGAMPSGFSFENQVPLVGVASVGGSSKSNPLRRRLVACSRAGEIRFAVSDGDFASFSIWSPNASQSNPATGMLLSCDDRTLAVTHADGRLVIWHADPSSSIDSSASRSLVPEFSHFFDHDVELTKKSVVPLDDGSVAILFLGKTKSATTRELILARWHPERRQWKARSIRQIPVSEKDPGTLDSIALTRIGQQIFGCVREQTQGHRARCFLFHVSVQRLEDIESVEIVEEIVGDDRNAYLEHSLFEHDEAPAFTHFAYDRVGLLYTRKTDGGWVTSQLGRQGDGMHSNSLSIGGRVVTVGLLNRVNSDVGQWYRILQSLNQDQPDQRIPVDPQCLSLAMLVRDENGHPAIVYSRHANQGTESYAGR